MAAAVGLSAGIGPTAGPHKSVLFLLDCSYSMNEGVQMWAGGPQSETRMAMASSCINELFDHA